MIYGIALGVVAAGAVGVSSILLLLGCATWATQQAEEADEDEFSSW